MKLQTADNVAISAAYFSATRTPKASLLMLHGNGADMRFLSANAQWFRLQGFHVLTLDFRGHGLSQAKSKSFGYFEAFDADAGAAWLLEANPKLPLAIVGISLGGASALIGRGGPVQADAYVLQAVYPNIRSAIEHRIACKAGRVAGSAFEPLLSFQSKLRFGVWPGELSPLNRIAHIHKPILIIAGGKDCYTPPTEAKRLHAAAGGEAEIWVVDDLTHVEVSSLQTLDYRRRILEFLDQNLTSIATQRSR